jgi:glutamyl-tRNA synthetase/glutamyl-Q tRNA(Asp) synthetase
MLTRFAPSLTGYLHLGHVLHMIQVWGVARSRNGKVLSRIEDHDLARNRPEYEPAILTDMQWLGFEPDLGITAADAPSPSPYRQSDCARHYEEALCVLADKELVYGCECSRKQIMQVSNGDRVRMQPGAPASADSEDAVPPIQFHELCYPGTCAEKNLPLEGNTVRFRITDGEVDFHDLALGDCRQTPMTQCGDFSLRDRNGQWTYQFCCVCDDIRHGINLVVRGEDILSSTGRQIQLFQALEHEPLRYYHHGLLCDENGQKLSKRQRSESITRLREDGVDASEIIGRAAFSGGLIPECRPLSVEAATALFRM